MAPEVRLNGPDNEPLGVVPIQEALRLAGEYDVDLVEVVATANPPVCRLMDYGKFKYLEQKKAAEAKAKQTVIEIKEVKFRPGTDDGDFNIKMRNQVQDLRADEVMQNEYKCRTGIEQASSALCVDTLSRIVRGPDGGIYSVYVNPINIAREDTSGLDFSANFRVPTRIGDFALNGSYTWVDKHEIQPYPDQAVIDMFAVNSGYDIPRTKASARLSWSRAAWSASVQGQRLGRLPNGWSYDEVWEDGDPGPTIEATYRYNGNLQYNFSDRAQLSLSVVNLTDEKPPVDPTYTSYPYYDISWFDTEGRSYFLQFTYKFGGKPLE